MCLIAVRAHSFARVTPAGELAYVPLVTTRAICAEIRRGFLARRSGSSVPQEYVAEEGSSATGGRGTTASQSCHKRR